MNNRDLWVAQADAFIGAYMLRNGGRLLPAAFASEESRLNFVGDYQVDHGLVRDRKAGWESFCHLLEICWPVTSLGDRHPIITRGDAPGHYAADIAFSYVEGDEKSPTRYVKEGAREFSFPSEAIVVAMADGIVTDAKWISTGYWVWIGIANLFELGCFHGSQLLVSSGQSVVRGQPIMEEGFDPRHGENLIHVHGEKRKDGVRSSMTSVLRYAAHVTR